MKSITIPRTGLPDLTFVGEQIAEASGVRDNKLTGGRYHDVRVYLADDDQWIVEVHFCSPVTTELSDHIADAVDNVQEIDDLLSLYNPTERVDFSAIESTQQRRNVETGLTGAFDNQVISVLNACEAVTSNAV